MADDMPHQSTILSMLLSCQPSINLDGILPQIDHRELGNNLLLDRTETIIAQNLL